MSASFKLLEGIVAFVEVVSNGSFTKAAEISGHSTSYISKEISKLEERLGIRLLNRTTRSLSLTPEGEVYYQQCQQIVNDAEQAEQFMTGQQQKPKGLLRVSCPVNIGLSKLRPVLAKFTSLYKGVQLELELTDRKVDMVAEGYDVVIRASVQLEDSSLISRRFMSSQAITVAAPSYLRKNGLPKKPSDLVHHQTISYAYIKQPKLWTYTDKDGRPTQVNVDSQVVTNSGEMNLALCIAGKGITRIPLFHLTDEIEKNMLVELFEDYPKIDIDVHLVYPSRKHMSSKVRSFIDFVIAELGD
ncbi:LysR family transcriptional regulator [Psychrosphaera sp. F3M07]|uniref:LysR family transcriptional regulator n=1 Tax=Psychrosphaera aquimarina TaxID=2044854 RepID=A0ABU3QYM6_9GAMM|nr:MULTISPECIES: LysR family transcriptional regulator [Psychrosphaera]MBU2918126.1 LysR family transcriptional regulator [Psychrosphaera sp. F3M07]MDU0112519.1 LysR family transcriptional regulator [Psychrosphaera aquimarina]